MSTFIIALKAEISRLAKREIKKTMTSLQSAVSKHRLALASLKQDLATLRQQVLKPAAPAVPNVTDKELKQARFSGWLIKKLRRRLELSQLELGTLVGTSMVTVGNWERGTSRPDDKNQRALIAVRKLGKRAARQMIAQNSTVTKK